MKYQHRPWKFSWLELLGIRACQKYEQLMQCMHMFKHIYTHIRVLTASASMNPPFSWGGWPCEKKIPPPLAMLPNLILSRLSGHSDPIVLEPFDATLWYSGVTRTPNFLMISSNVEGDFRNGFSSAHCTQIWKLNRISMTIISNVARKCIWCCHRVQRCVTASLQLENLCSGAWKRGQDNHVGMFSLCTCNPLDTWTQRCSSLGWNLWQRQHFSSSVMSSDSCEESESSTGIICMPEGPGVRHVEFYWAICELHFPSVSSVVSETPVIWYQVGFFTCVVYDLVYPKLCHLQ